MTGLILIILGATQVVAMDRDKREEKGVEKKETDLFGLD